ncbi:MAG: excinuclease ABC subunit UvrB [Deltaproteobacteria bacterium]|nr:excinuclease ABC subunit UvrB [Deltaproteobacteria bacterium]MBI3293663.1 excinuclease ABC subunit UvrB [Deltaproteobacteria bacterium]
MPLFQLESPFKPRGDQPKAITQISETILAGGKNVVLLGVTGSGKTFTMAHVIANLERPTLVMAPNKTLAAQLYSEFRELFPKNAVEYFVSYYDYYQPEAYIPSSDTYIEKDSAINDQIDQLRHSATRSLLSRRDVIIVASVSCIYGLGSPEQYREMVIAIKKGEEFRRDNLLLHLVEIQYERNDIDFHRGTFRVRGDVVEIFPAFEENLAYRVHFWGDEVEKIEKMDPLTGRTVETLDHLDIYPGSHYVTERDQLTKAIKSIQEELRERLTQLKTSNALVEAQRLESRTYYDIEMLEEMGYCNGIENYSRHLTGRAPGAPPPTLIEYFPSDFLLFIDESHVTVPQIGGMYRGDRARKETLVTHGFRLPSALDNRPLNFSEFESLANVTVYVSATPGDFEMKKSAGRVIEQIIRPTGLLDPTLVIRPARGAVDDLYQEIRKRIEKKQRVLVTTLTKRMAEDLTEYYQKMGIKVQYLHSDIDALERVEIIRQLRMGVFDVLVGINLLREGLDIPECGLVAILDADKEGFLRSARSLTQTIGRAARNLDGTVILYADRETDSIRFAVSETERRRKIQLDYNTENNITPQSVQKNIQSGLYAAEASDYYEIRVAEPAADYDFKGGNISKEITRVEKLMRKAASQLQFERAAELRDRLNALKRLLLDLPEQR